MSTPARILGISAFHRDAAAALVVDGRPIAAARESQFSRTPLDPAFPSRAIRFCLDHAGLSSRDLDHVVFYEKPLRKFERVLAVQLRSFPKSARSFASGMFQWLGDRLWIKNRIAKELDFDPTRVRFTEHQLSLAAVAYYLSPFEAAAVLTLDDVGEWATGSIGIGRGAELELKREIQFPDSLGLFASAITQFLGFVPGEEEHMVESLAAFGEPSCAAALRALVADDEGYFHVDQAPFRFAFDSDRLFGDSLIDRLGSPRYSGDVLAIEGSDTRHADIAASLQLVLEERALALAKVTKELTDCDNLCVAGQLATNRRMITRLAEDGPFASVFVPPASDKAGGALGAALYVHHAGADSDRRVATVSMDLGEGIDERGARAEPGARPLSDPVAELSRRLYAGERLAWVRGRLEFGDHGGGRRAILALPHRVSTVRELLGAIQHTERFLPCRLAMTAESAENAFVWPGGSERTRDGDSWQIRATKELREAAPGAIAPDGTAWPLVVHVDADPEFHALLVAVGQRSGMPVLLLADFRPRGGTVVRSESDAVEAFRRSTLDALVVANRLYVPGCTTACLEE
jgi:carbamoyltransferase